MVDLTPMEWLARLEKRRAAQAAEHEKWDRYYRGDHPLPNTPEKLRQEYLRLMRMSRSNWMELVVDARVERLSVEGFRFAESTQGDDRAWEIWQANHLDADQEQVYTDALAGGRGAVLVWPNTTTGEPPVITVEDPRAVAVEYEPGSTRRRIAAMKSWREDDTLRANLWTPDGMYRRYRANVKGETTWTTTSNRRRWELIDEVESPLRAPIVEFRTRLRSDGTCSSILANGPTDIQDRINKTLFDRLLAAEFAAFRQRWITGYEIPVDEETGQPVEEFKAAVDRLWVFDNNDATLGEFSATDLGPYISSIESDVQHLAAITRTPPHYLLGQAGAFPSGESLKSTETGLVATVRRHAASFGESWEEVERLAFAALGDTERAGDMAAETIWRNPEARTEGELVDALLKMAQLGVPEKALWERWGATDREIKRWEAEGVLSDLFTRPPAEPAPGG